MQTIFFVLVYTEYAYLYLFSHCRGGYLFPFLKVQIVKYMYMFVSDVHAGIDIFMELNSTTVYPDIVFSALLYESRYLP